MQSAACAILRTNCTSGSIYLNSHASVNPKNNVPHSVCKFKVVNRNNFKLLYLNTFPKILSCYIEAYGDLPCWKPQTKKRPWDSIDLSTWTPKALAPSSSQSRFRLRSPQIPYQEVAKRKQNYSDLVILLVTFLGWLL